MSIGADWTPHHNAGEGQTSSFDAWALCLRRKWLILFVLCVNLGLGYLYFTQAPRWYEASAQIMVVKKDRGGDVPVQKVSNTAGLEDSLSTHLLLIKSPEIIAKAIRDHGLEQLRSLQGDVPVHAQIRAELEALRAGGKEAPDANVILLTFCCKDPQDCTLVINAIIDSYKDYLGESYQDVNAETQRLITSARDDYEKRLKELWGAYRKMQQESPLIGTGSNEMTVPEMRLRQIETELTSLVAQRTKTVATIGEIEQALKDGTSRRESLILMARALGDYNQLKPGGTRVGLEDQLFPLLLQQQLLLAQYGENHPQVKAIEKQIQITTQYIENRRLDLAEDESQAFRGDFLTVYLESLRHELAAADARERQLLVLREKERAEAKSLLLSKSREEDARSEIARTQQMYDALVKAFEELSLIKDTGGYNNKVIAQADHAVMVSPNKYKVAGVATFMGVLLGFGLAYLVDMSDKSFRSPEEIRHELGVPILGHIPVLVPEGRWARRKKEPSKVGHMVLAYHQPKSTMAESYRAVRTALNFGTRGEGHKVIQITSPDPGDGKTTLVANLAVSIAQSGKRVLLIDADFRRPRVHRAFGTEHEMGLSSVIRGEGDLPDAIQPTEMENLFVLPCGPRPSNPSELLGQPQFKELLDVVREQYDLVLVDTPPVLAVTDPSVVAPRVDGLLLLIRITKHVRPHSRRAIEILESLGANVMGIVVNGVGGTRPSVGYGFGQQYGYRYAYAAGYDDFSEHRYGHYYSDDDEDVPATSKNGAARRSKADMAAETD